MRNPDIAEVVDSIIQGINNTQEDYKKAYESDVCSSYAPEYLMIVYIFQSILELNKKNDHTYGLSLEEPVHELARLLRAHPRYPYHARVYGYCDVSIRDVNNSDKPRAMIEVKKYAWNYSEEIGRLAYFVEKGLKFGVFASCWFEEVRDDDCKEAEDRLEKEIQCIHEHIEKDISELGYNLNVDRKPGNIAILRLDGDKETWKWCPVCFVIQNKKRTSGKSSILPG